MLPLIHMSYTCVTRADAKQLKWSLNVNGTHHFIENNYNITDPTPEDQTIAMTMFMAFQLNLLCIATDVSGAEERASAVQDIR